MQAQEREAWNLTVVVIFVQVVSSAEAGVLVFQLYLLGDHRPRVSRQGLKPSHPSPPPVHDFSVASGHMWPGRALSTKRLTVYQEGQTPNRPSRWQILHHNR